MLGHIPTYILVNNTTRIPLIPTFIWLCFSGKCIRARCTTLKIQSMAYIPASLVPYVTRIPAFTCTSHDSHPSIHWYVMWHTSQHSLVRHVTHIPAFTGTSHDTSQHALEWHVTRMPAFTCMTCDTYPSIHWYVMWHISQHSLVRRDFPPSSHWLWHHWYNIISLIYPSMHHLTSAFSSELVRFRVRLCAQSGKHTTESYDEADHGNSSNLSLRYSLASKSSYAALSASLLYQTPATRFGRFCTRFVES